MGRFLLTQMAAVAELEAGLIGERTKNALAAAKKRIARTGQRGRPDIKRLGNPNGARALKGKQVGNTEAVAKLKATATQRAADLKAIVEDIKRSGVTSVRGIADELHSRGIRAPRGDTWHPTAVARLLNRLSPQQ
jgi:DNA invertase Pin-like site-specific DNA recombinase